MHILQACKGMEHRSISSLIVNQKRQFLLTATATLVGSMIMNENNRLANKMEKGQLHYKDANAIFNKALEAQESKYFSRSKLNYPGMYHYLPSKNY